MSDECVECDHRYDVDDHQGIESDHDSEVADLTEKLEKAQKDLVDFQSLVECYEASAEDLSTKIGRLMLIIREAETILHCTINDGEIYTPGQLKGGVMVQVRSVLREALKEEAAIVKTEPVFRIETQSNDMGKALHDFFYPKHESEVSFRRDPLPGKLRFVPDDVPISQTVDHDSFMKSVGLNDFERDVIWSMLAHALRSRAVTGKPYKSTLLSTLLRPFSYFLTEGLTVDIDQHEFYMETLCERFNHGIFLFPFGELHMIHGWVWLFIPKDEL